MPLAASTPLILALAGLFALALKSRPARAARLVETGALAALLAAGAAIANLVSSGPAAATLFPATPWAVGLRFDAVAAAMLGLVAFIGLVVARYARTYLDGEPGQARFMGWLALTLAAVTLLVQAGSLAVLLAAWVATSLALHRLLLFYPERPGARRAAAKKFVVARAGDLVLAVAAGLLMVAYGTGEIGAILAAARAGEGGMAAIAAAALLAVAALLKSAQFPFHGWLTEVMETPTPVSALLHAGVINAGGFLLIRFADVLLLAPGVLAILALVGGFTALVAGLVMLTQPAIKTQLAWSTIAQMGFMILECGLALFPLALLHVVAHSLYKAHAFLSAGNAVAEVAAARRPGPVAVPSLRAVGGAFLLALGIYAGVGVALGFEDKAPQAIALGAILVMGVAYLVAQGLAGGAPAALTRRTLAAATAASIGYFALQTLAAAATAGALPAVPAAGPLEWAVIVLAIASFGLVALAQALFPLWAHHPAALGLRVHLSNGLYLNALFDRLVGNWALVSSGRKG
jgi:NAD(P)H-quinone oxidoreductase subunit 5